MASGTDSADQLWIGLRGSESCTCFLRDPSIECNQCRDQFMWEDETNLNENVLPWTFNEPRTNERCVRITNTGELNGTPCNLQLDYVCFRGK